MSYTYTCVIMEEVGHIMYLVGKQREREREREREIERERVGKPVNIKKWDGSKNMIKRIMLK